MKLEPLILKIKYSLFLIDAYLSVTMVHIIIKRYYFGQT